jgi:hypothetical protein
MAHPDRPLCVRSPRQPSHASIVGQGTVGCKNTSDCTKADLRPAEPLLRGAGRATRCASHPFVRGFRRSSIACGVRACEHASSCAGVAERKWDQVGLDGDPIMDVSCRPVVANSRDAIEFCVVRSRSWFNLHIILYIRNEALAPVLEASSRRPFLGADRRDRADGVAAKPRPNSVRCLWGLLDSGSRRGWSALPQCPEAARWTGRHRSSRVQHRLRRNVCRGAFRAGRLSGGRARRHSRDVGSNPGQRKPSSRGRRAVAASRGRALCDRYSGMVAHGSHNLPRLEISRSLLSCQPSCGTEYGCAQSS